MYWLTIVAPLIDAGKTIVKCVGDGIEQGKADVQEAKKRANIELFKNSYSSRIDPIDNYLP